MKAKDVNSVLYTLNKAGLLHATPDKPPVWSVEKPGAASVPVSVPESDRVPSPSETPGITVEELRRVLTSKSDGRGMSVPQFSRELGQSRKLVTMSCDNRQGDQSALKERIYTFLKVKKQGFSALQIAKAVGLIKAKDVNSVLYTLNRAGLLHATPDKPPVWSVEKPGAASVSVSVPESDQVPSPSETPGITEEGLRRVLMSKSDGRGMSAQEIARELGQTRKCVNKHLYDLKSSGKAEKLGEKVWKMKDEASCGVELIEYQSHLPRHLEVTMSCDNQQGDQSALKKRICDFLEVKKQGSTALQIAKAVGLKKAKDVNSVLYTLNRAGLLHATPDKPPVWSVEKPGAASVSVSVPESDRVPSPSETPGITEEELRRVLMSKSDGRGMSVQEIARELGQSRKCVNKNLYDLQSSGKAEKLGEKMWKMKDEASCGGELIEYHR
ncbi:unnamed protein product [Oncorhynchus mykiss]|uniref:Z-binding domain-containing protein n=1 Tax=Oncorhynchus mykiss TaxID=8022 RepID=A0A060YF65_ONCMY|nr:unnamed protein product [Oncorhynchus mykiss]